MNIQKNFPLLIQAFTKFYETHPDYMLTVYGDGELRDEMENMAASLLPKKSYDFPGNSPNQW